MRLTDFQKIVAMNTIAGIGTGLVGLFIPIYLLELGNSPFTVVIWLLIHHVSLLLGVLPAIYSSNTIGLVQTWYIRIFLVITLFTGLLLLPDHPNILFILAFISGMEGAFFWIPYNVFTVRKTEEKTMGSSLAFMSNVGSAVGIIIPGIAALLIVYVGYGILFLIAMAFIAISIIPVLSLRHEKTTFRFSLSEMGKTARENKHFIVPEILDNLGQDAQIIWTIFLFVASLTILDIGTLGVIAGLAGMIVTHLTGSLIDKWNKKAVMRFGAVATTIMWILSYIVAIYSPTPTMLYIVTILRGFSLGIFVSAYGTIMFNRARNSDTQFLILREIPTIFGRVIIFTITLILLSLGRFELAFLAVGILSLYFWFNNIDKLLERSKS